jgi:hypothetical protein
MNKYSTLDYNPKHNNQITSKYNKTNIRQNFKSSKFVILPIEVK